MALEKQLQLLNLLSDSHFISGSDLAASLQVSKSSIASWVCQLNEFGLDVHSLKGRGYKLSRQIKFLDKEKILSQIQPDPKGQLSACNILFTTSSTNDAATSLKLQRNSWGLIAAEHQTSGRGRRERNWLSPACQNIMMSLVHRDYIEPKVLYSLSLIVGVSIVKTLNEIFHCNAKVKWPNDIYINGLKAAGILCELKSSTLDETLIVIGVGLNVNYAPNLVDREVTCLSDVAGRTLDRSELLGRLVNNLITDLEDAKEDGHPSILAEWNSLDFLADKDVTLHLGEKNISGRYIGIDEIGQLQLLVNEDIQKFSGGEVSVRC